MIALDTAWNKLGLAVRKSQNGDFQILTVHQVAALLVKWWVRQNEKDPVLFIKSIHISDMVQKIALRDDKEIESLILDKDQLSETIRSIASERKDMPILGFTENQEFISSTGSLTDIAEQLIKWESELQLQEQTLFDAVLQLYQEYGFYKEKTFTVEVTEPSQAEHIKHQMDALRKNSPIVKERLSIDRLIDYKKGVSTNFLTNKKLSLSHPSTDILQVWMEDGTAVSLVPEKNRMSYYISMTGRFISKDNFSELNKSFDGQIFKLMQTLNSLK